MIRKDFFDGGFPISKRSPVICTGKLKVPMNVVPSMTLCYNHLELKKAIEGNEFPSLCIGIWPGKKTTDGFILDPSAYSKLAPPEEHADIDSAQSITVIFNTDNTFNKLLYTPGIFAGSQVPIMSQDKALYEYVKNAALKFTAVIE